MGSTSPDLDDDDQEAIRQHAIAALNLTQKAKEVVNDNPDIPIGSSAFVDGVRQYAMDVRELDIDLIDRINPFGQAYSILAKSMNEESLKQVAAIITGKRINLTIEEARDLAKRALKFKNERGRLPEITSNDPWERRMAEGIAFLQRKTSENG
ncbi:helicase [Chromatiales bacterium (ex Bugula neritina AB1)]|nr:helicase [Chromatiales bacterium (ex Bugula neritina AB1)]